MIDRTSSTRELERGNNLRDDPTTRIAQVVMRPLATQAMPADRDGIVRDWLAQPGRLAQSAQAVSALAREPMFDAGRALELIPPGEARAPKAAPHLYAFTASLPNVRTPADRQASGDALERAVEFGGARAVTGFLGNAIDTRKRAEPKPTIEVMCRPGEQNRELSRPLPNTIYKATELDERGTPLVTRTYETDALARTIRAEGQLVDIKGTRNQNDQQRVGGKDRRRGTPDPNDDPRNHRDDGGHLIATEFNGPGEAINMVAMDSRLNQHGAWRKMEERWGDEMRSGKKVEVAIRPVYKGESQRPDSIRVIERIDGKVKSYTWKNEPEGK